MLAMGDSALRKGADAMTFVGCDLHTRMQQVAVLDTGTGESSVLTRLHHEPEEGLDEVTRRHSNATTPCGGIRRALRLRRHGHVVAGFLPAAAAPFDDPDVREAHLPERLGAQGRLAPRPPREENR